MPAPNFQVSDGSPQARADRLVMVTLAALGGDATKQEVVRWALANGGFDAPRLAPTPAGRSLAAQDMTWALSRAVQAGTVVRPERARYCLAGSAGARTVPPDQPSARANRPAPSPPTASEESRPDAVAGSDGYDPAGGTTPQLLADWAAIMRELRVRDVVRTNNNPTGDIAEAIVAAHYGGERGSFAQAGWDVKTASGERIQVKAMRKTTTTTRRNLSPIRDSDYESVVVVIFDEDFNVTEGLKLPRAVVEDMFAIKSYVNGRVISVTQTLRDDPRVESIDLAETARRLHG